MFITIDDEIIGCRNIWLFFNKQVNGWGLEWRDLPRELLHSGLTQWIVKGRWWSICWVSWLYISRETPHPPPNAPVCCLTLIRANKTEEMSLLAGRVRVLGALFGYNLLAHCQDIKSCPRQAGRWLVSLSVCVRPAPCPHSPCPHSP